MNDFDGWLLKVNGTIFPSDYILTGSYKSTPDQETDMDDYTDADGILHRNVLPGKATKIEFNIRPVHLNELREIRRILPHEKQSVEIEYWNDYDMCYQSGSAYIPSISFETYMVDESKKDILYKATRIAFIEYGEVRT